MIRLTSTNIWKIILFIIFTLTACDSNTALKSITQENKNFENQFFSLDFTEQNLDIEDFKEHFFTTFPHDDPTLGKAVYNEAKWLNKNIIQVKQGKGLYAFLKLREDSLGFDSFRFTTKSFYNLSEDTDKILFVFKGVLPSAKGIWPAWWLNGSNENEWTYRDTTPAVNNELLNRYTGIGNYYDTPSPVNATDWPSGGEIDIIENINGEKYIHNTIHTCPQMCDSEWNNDGIILNCANANANDVNPGCSGRKYIIEKLEGTFACVWEKEMINFYYWSPEFNVKDNGGPLSSAPNPKLWDNNYLMNSVRLFNSNSECIDSLHQSWQCENCSEINECKFQNLKMIFNTTLCGVWAGNKFDSTSNSISNCEEYIKSEGKDKINGKFMKIEYVSVSKL